MKLICTLIRREFAENCGRVAISVFAILVSVSLIVWMMGSYDTLVKEFDNDAESYMGRYDLCLVPKSPAGPPEPSQTTGFGNLDFVNRLQHDPQVEFVHTANQVPRLQIGCANEHGSFDDQTRDRMGIPPQSPALVGNDASECPYELKEGIWPDMAQSSDMVGVLGSGSARLLQAKLGTVMQVRVGGKVVDVKVVGIVKQTKSTTGIIMGPGMNGGPSLASLFVPKKAYESIMDRAFEPNLVSVSLKEGIDKQAFLKGLESELAQSGAVVSDTDSIIQRLSSDRSVRQQKDSAEMSVWLVLFSCVFIIFTTLSIGVSERVRKLALLRALGLSRFQISLLIVGEGVLLCIPALIGGLIAGLCLVFFTEEGESGLPSLSWSSVMIAAMCAIGGALLASIIPAWRASRLSPLEAAAPQETLMTNIGRIPSWSVIVGLLCLCIQPAALFLPGLSVEVRKTLFTWGGFPGLVAGALFLAPLFVKLTEQLSYRLVGALLRIPAPFLKLQLSRNLSRSVGTAVSMSVGLGLFVAVQTWGYSMLAAFTPDESTPGTLVSFLHTEFNESDVSELMARPSLKEARMYPIYVDEPDIAPAQLKSPAFENIRNRSVVMAGIPLDLMAEGSDPLFHPVFVEGSPEEAMKMLRSTRSLLIPDTFARQVGLHPGDELRLVNPNTSKKSGAAENMMAMGRGGMGGGPDGRRVGRPAGADSGFDGPRSGGRPDGMGGGMRRGGRGGVGMSPELMNGEAWKVAGVISYPGWHWLTKTSGMRVRRGGFIAALVITDERWLKQDYGHQTFQFIWGNTPKEVSATALQDDLGGYAREKVQEQKKQVQPLVKALTRESLSGSVGRRGDDVIFTMSQLPIIMMVIAALAVLNTILGSVQSRRREFGLLRVVGVPGSMVMRMLWAESLMLSLCAIVLSFILGVFAAWSSIQILAYGYHFGIVTPPLSLPWGHLGAAVLLVLAMSSLACLVPAWRMKKASALELTFGS